MNSRNHWPVNWVDGMKINKSHFQQQEAAFGEEVSLLAAVGLTDDTYGLLPPEAGGAGLELIVTSERVELRGCRGITRGGHLLFVGPDNNTELQRRMSDLMYGRDFSEADAWLVLLRLHPGERIEVGAPDPEETPLRHPFAAARLSLEVVPAQHLHDATAYTHALPLARITRTYQGIEMDREFVPPVCRVNASEQLLQLHQHWKQLLLTMEGDTFEIIKKINDKHRNNQGNQLSADLLRLTQAVIRYINEHFDAYRLLAPEQAPVHLFLWFISLARMIKNELRLAGNQENMLNYMAHFIEGVSPTDLMRFCNDLCDPDYDHAAIRETADRVTSFLDFITRLFAALRGLDYHQIANPTIIDSRSIRGGGLQYQPVQPTRPNTRAGGGAIRISGRSKDGNSSPNQPPPSGDGDGGGGWDLT